MNIENNILAGRFKFFVLMLFLIGEVVLGQINTRDQALPGHLFINFKRDAITSIPRDLNLTDISNLRLRGHLERIGLTKAQKVFRDATPADTTAIARTGESVKQIDLSRWYRLRVDPEQSVAALIDSLRLLPGVEAVSPVFGYFPHAVPNDPKFYKQKGLNATTGMDIHAVAAWDINKGRNDVIVAVVDGGIDYDHIDLDPGDRSRIIQGYDTADEDSDPDDDCVTGWINGGGFGGHGTAVAGIIGALTDNSAGIAGVMWNAKIMPVKVASTYGPEWYPYGMLFGTPAAPWDVAQGIDYAKNNGAHIINMSIGYLTDALWENPIWGNPVGEAVWNAYNAGVLLIAAMGNENTDDTSYPAAFPRVMAVGASNSDDQRADFSNYGSHISVVAPGTFNQIYTTDRYNNYNSFNGTSGAAPMVAGTAGLIISQSLDRGLNLTNDDVQHLLEITADDIVDIPDGAGTGWDEKTGFGRINAESALQYLEPPYTVTHGSATGGSSQLSWGSHTHTFHGGTGSLPAGVYYGVKQYKVTKSVSFPNAYGSVPIVWMRERSTVGWNAANPNRALPWAKIESVTTEGSTFSTYVYFIKYNLLGQEINEWHPSSASNVTFAYTVLGPPP